MIVCLAFNRPFTTSKVAAWTNDRRIGRHKMNNNAASELMHHLDRARGRFKVGKAPQTTQEWLETLGLPMTLLRFMQWSWPQAECQLAGVELFRSKDIQKQDDIAEFLARKLLPVGKAGSGDRFVIDFSIDSCPVGFVTLSEYGGVGDPREFFRPAARSVESFLYRVSEHRYFPNDYYSTGDFNDFLRDEATHEQFPPYRPIN